MTHTKEPWELRDGWAGSIFYKEQCIARTCEPTAEANARRIVAAVNACAEISTDALEEAARSDMRVSEMLLQQRDELLNALEIMLNFMGMDEIESNTHIFNQARKAIAKVQKLTMT